MVSGIPWVERGRFVCVALLGAGGLVFLAGCKLSGGSSGTKAVNAPEALNQDLYAENTDKDKTVIIYYANETSTPTPLEDDATNHEGSRNLSDIRFAIKKAQDVDSISDDEKKRLTAFRDRLTSDWKHFQESTVNNGIHPIYKRVCGSYKNDPIKNTEIALFTNDFAVGVGYGPSFGKGAGSHWLRCGEYESFDTSHLESAKAQYKWNPLSHPDSLRKALAAVKKTYPPGKGYRYILITRSHGAAPVAIAPMISLDARSMTDKEIWTRVLNYVDSEEALQKSGQNPITKPGQKPITEDGQKPITEDGQKPITEDGQKPITEDGQKPITEDGQKPITEDGQKPITEDGQKPITEDGKRINEYTGIGISKREYVDILASSGLELDIVFMDACASDLSLMPDRTVDETWYVGSLANVGYLFTSDEDGLAYDVVNYMQALDPEAEHYPDSRAMLFQALSDVEGLGSPTGSP